MEYEEWIRCTHCGEMTPAAELCCPRGKKISWVLPDLSTQGRADYAWRLAEFGAPYCTMARPARSSACQCAALKKADADADALIEAQDRQTEKAS